MEDAVTPKRDMQSVVKIALHILAFCWLPLFLLIIVADDKIVALNPQGRGPWPDSLPRTAEFDKWISVRIASYFGAIFIALITLPRIQSILGLLLVVGYFLFRFWQSSSF